jgi:hypothetical protein
MALSGGAGVDELVGGAAARFSSLSVIVDVEGDLENVLERGPKWVSFNSRRDQVSMVALNQLRRLNIGMGRTPQTIAASRAARAEK